MCSNPIMRCIKPAVQADTGTQTNRHPRNTLALYVLDIINTLFMNNLRKEVEYNSFEKQGGGGVLPLQNTSYPKHNSDGFQSISLRSVNASVLGAANVLTLTPKKIFKFGG